MTTMNKGRAFGMATAIALAFTTVSGFSSADQANKRDTKSAKQPTTTSAAPATPEASEPSLGAPVGGLEPSGFHDVDARLAAAFDSSKGLKSDDAAKRAVATSHDVFAKKQAHAASEGSLEQAKYEFIPRLTATGRYTRLSSIDPPSLGTAVAAPSVGAGPIPAGTQLVNVPLTVPVILNQASAQAALSLPISDYLLRLTQKYNAAKYNEESTRLDEEASKRLTAANARIAYYDWVRSKLQVIIAQQSLAQAKGHVTDANTNFTAGTGSRADVLRAESQVASSELLVERALSALARREDRLKTLLHDDNLNLSLIGEDVRTDPPAMDLNDNVGRLIADAMDRRVEIKALEKTSLSLHEQARAARALYFPRLDGVAEVTSASPNQRIFPQTEELRTTWSAGVTLTWSPNDILLGGAGTKTADAKEAEVIEKKKALIDTLRAEVVDAHQALIESTAALKSARRGVAASEESHRVRVALYQTGRATSTELLDSETDVLRARLNVVDAFIDARLARVRLLHATGRDPQS